MLGLAVVELKESLGVTLGLGEAAKITQGSTIDLTATAGELRGYLGLGKSSGREMSSPHESHRSPLVHFIYNY